VADSQRLDQARALFDSYRASMLALVPPPRQEHIGGLLWDLRGALLLAVDAGRMPGLERELADSVLWCRASLLSITREVRSTWDQPDSPPSSGSEG
jgi:hypothetical protein